MKIFLDAHIHSRFSRATSKSITIENLSRHAKMKGLNLLGTGDFCHPIWLSELKENLTEIDDTGIFQSRFNFNFILSTEVSNIYTHDGKIKKIHNIILAKNFDIVDQINEELKKSGSLEIDGRPTFNNLSCPELVEILTSISKDIVIIPAHIYTPWFSLFGSKSGFNSVKECFQEQRRHIFALETGLSSDPKMSWRVSELDRYSLVSFSDSHSPWYWRIGRESSVFELKELTFDEIINAMKSKDPKRFLMTTEFFPEEGKYHYTGHRACGINLNPKDALKLNNICPKCGRKLTVGVLQRVEELADRPDDFVPKNAIPFKNLLTLYDIISHITGVSQLYSRKVIEEQDKLIKEFSNEFNVLLNAPIEELKKVTSEKIAEAIVKVREGSVKYIPGFDGVYGRPVFDEKEFNKLKRQQEIKAREQKSLKDFGKGPVV